MGCTKIANKTVFIATEARTSIASKIVAESTIFSRFPSSFYMQILVSVNEISAARY
jgi:hypothetical protein